MYCELCEEHEYLERRSIRKDESYIVPTIGSPPKTNVKVWLSFGSNSLTKETIRDRCIVKHGGVILEPGSCGDIIYNSWYSAYTFEAVEELGSARSRLSE
jgi:hypothetical protein